MNHKSLKSLLLFGFWIFFHQAVQAQSVVSEPIYLPQEKNSLENTPRSREAKPLSPKTEFIEFSNDGLMKAVPFYSSIGGTDPVGRITRGEIVKIQSKKIVNSYGPNWRQVDGANVWFHYDLENMKSLSSESGFELQLRSTVVNETQPLYREPGFWKPKDCKLDSTLCLANLTSKSRLTLLRVSLRPIDKSRLKEEQWLSFYEIAYQPERNPLDGNKKPPVIIGWLPSDLLIRDENADAKRMEALKDKMLAENPPPPPPPPPPDQSGLFILNNNSVSPERRKLLLEGIDSQGVPAESIRSITGLTLRYTSRLGVSTVNVSQPFANADYVQQCATLGASVVSNLFLDLTLSLDFDIHLPVTASDHNQSIHGYFLDSEELLTYTTSSTVNKVPVKVAVGAYYISLVSGRPVGGLPGLVGFESKVILDGKTFSTGVRYAPVAQDLNIDFHNRLLGMELSYKTDWKIDERAVQVRLSLEDIFYKNQQTSNFTALKTIGLNLLIPLTF